MGREQSVISSLDLEAADYFKLEPDQVQLLCSPIRRKQMRPDRTAANQKRAPCKSKNSSANEPVSSSAGSCKKQALENSSNSSSSLPSISSSPSVSPSLVCPHLSLDDILERRGGSRSPHTIGLCAKCRLNPPPNVQSPLSPLLMLSTARTQPSLKRGHSDHRAAPRATKKLSKVLSSSSGCLRDDSLDCCLEPADLRRIQMSPSERHSVGYMRNNSIESARVLRIYKNGQPFDRPLRVCVTRTLFPSLNHLLDHINGRQLIPSGARYLFHLDGQLVYSVHELKHGSVYVVSGTRAFNTKANSVIKKRLTDELLAKAQRTSGVRVGAAPPPSGRPKESLATSQPQPQVRPTQIVKQKVATKALTRKISSVVDKEKSTRKVKSQNVGNNKSSENINTLRDEKSPTITRAKSELSALPSKRKKNVTFFDTGRGSSPAISEPQQAAAAESDNKALGTNEIGIQVSDSIDGFLIDLPLPMPAKGDDSNVVSKNKIGTRPKPAPTYKARKQAVPKPARKQVVTITERQLSLDEMNQLRDLDHGDHHSEAHKVSSVTIKLDGAELEPEAEASSEVLAEKEPEASVPEAQKAVVVGQQNPELSADSEPPAELGAESSLWQYPGGSERSATPTERPVSQSEPNKSVHARVTTPSPSISTAGDSVSLTLSLDTLDDSAKAPKRRSPVRGRLVDGTSMPKSNFRLAWVNGFNINDQFPDNSTLTVVEPGRDQTAAYLSPAMATAQAGSGGAQFKPSERFHNWIFYSRASDELIFPAGCLLVLWCRKSCEQRYYSKHTGSVSALSLANVSNNLAASAQMASVDEKGGPNIHLWAIDSLETLRVLHDDQFRGRTIFSMRLRSVAQDGFELALAAKEDKRLWLFVISNLSTKPNEEQLSPQKKQASSPTRKPRIESVLRANKLLQASQVPLLIAGLGQLGSTAHQQSDQSMLSFGRRHFQVWKIDRRFQRLTPMQSDSRRADFVSVVTRATCLIKLAPSEFLVGDSQGQIHMLKVKIQPSTPSKGISNTVRNSVDQYGLELSLLADASSSNQAVTSLARVSGNLFVSSDSGGALRFWRLERPTAVKSDRDSSSSRLVCNLLACVTLPPDMGFVCTIMPATYMRKQMHLEFYVVLTSNVILFGALQLQSNLSGPAHSNLTVVYEGHETSAMNVVAADLGDRQNEQYFTCSVDCRICKWDKSRLVWKSVLPSACVALSIHPIGFVLAVGSVDGTVYILDKVSGLLVSYFPLTPVCINCLAYSRDGTLLAAGCANGSIFILPVYERGLKYKKVSIFQSPHPVVSLQFSLDNKYILTSVTQGSYQQLILWDLPNFRYMRDKVKMAANQINWFDSICSGSEDVRAIWENANLAGFQYDPSRRGSSSGTNMVINLSCHRLIGDGDDNYVIASDTKGYLRLFRYPCSDPQQGFYELRISSGPINCCRFISTIKENKQDLGGASFVSLSLDGTICQWLLE